jgi:hypothetical protein
MVNLWNYVEIMQCSIENEKSILSHFSPKVEIEHFSTQAMTYQ